MFFHPFSVLLNFLPLIDSIRKHLDLKIWLSFIGNIDPSKLDEPKRQLGLIGIMIGAGEITGVFTLSFLA